MPTRVLITGGTGALAREIIAAASGLDVTLRLTSRRAPTNTESSILDSALDSAHGDRSNAGSVAWMSADLDTGAGLAHALRDVDTVIHTASDSRRHERVDVEGTRRLVDCALTAGVSHLLYVSIVGIERIPMPYYESKLAAERIVAASGVPYSICRATQFHALIDARLRTAARTPVVMPVPTRFQFQTVDTREAARWLLNIAMHEPCGRAEDFGGPEILRMGDMAKLWRKAAGVSKPVFPLFLPGRVAAEFRRGSNTAPSGVRGTLTWREWLSRRYPARVSA